MPFSRKIHAYVALTRLHRPIGIYLLMWPMLWALWFASNGSPDWQVLLIFLAGTVLTRSAGCAVNDYADRHIDAHVARTEQRPLAAGVISAQEALGVTAALMIIAFLLVLLTNRLTILLSFVALALAVLYPFAKRYTHLPQLALGAAFSWAIPMVYAAQTESLPPMAWQVFLASVLWAVAYDTMYAMADREDDLKIGVKSTAILFGPADIAITITLQFVVLLIMAAAGWQLQRGWIFFISLLGAVVFVLYQKHLLEQRNPTSYIKAFQNNNYLGMCIFVGIVFDYMLQPGLGD